MMTHQMKIAVFDDYRLGVIDGLHVCDISGLVEDRWRGHPLAINRLIECWGEVRDQAVRLARTAKPKRLDEVRLLPPVPQPRQLFAAPLNYHQHITEMGSSPHVPGGLPAEQTSREMGFFVKAGGSICGPSDAIELPRWQGRVFHHECELGVVIGRTARATTRPHAREHVFGYTCLIDVTMRMNQEFQEERPMRKSFETFTPIGPWIVTADEVPDPNGLSIRLWVNDELRQDDSTARMIVGVDELIQRASAVVTLHPGDVYATGTPAGVGPIGPGDRVRIWIERVGEFTIPVRQRDW